MRNRVMRWIALSAVTALVVGFAPEAQAQNVLMNSAETINKGNFKLAAFPTALLGENGADNEWGIAGRVGYGLTRSVDIEGKLAVFDGITFYGGDAEAWVVRNPYGVNGSVSLGVHRTDYELGRDTFGIDTAMIMSVYLTRSVELYGGIQLGFESEDDTDRNFTRAHIVPGLEIRVTKELDFLAEYGVSLNDHSLDYVSIGLAMYFQ
ncbi:MAG: hypothetical protein JXO72_13665 [Vicinamibacteria bacterium]|nr:hypothetical protein [Vicinamibacteria bacterium]